MAYTKYMVAHFGKSRTGLATVGYTLTGGSRITAGVAEEATGSGIYGATVTFPDAFAGSIVWDTGEGAATLFAVEEENPLDVTDVLGSVLGSVGSVVDKAGFQLAADGLDAVAIEAGVNARQAVSVILASAAGVLSGVGSGTVVIRAGDNAATTRISATVSGGNRTGVTLTLPT